MNKFFLNSDKGKKCIVCICIRLWKLILFFLICCVYKCPFSNFLDIGCPGCGTTRAIMAALQFDFRMAFKYHPLFLIPVICSLYTVFRDGLHIRKEREQTFIIVFLSMYLLRWIILIIQYFMQRR